MERCNIIVRTLQRIESGEVTPRSHTLKLIFAELNYQSSGALIKIRTGLMNGSEQFKLFISKPKIIKRIIITLAVLLIISLSLFASIKNNKLTPEALETINNNYKRWYNNGTIDSCLTTFSDDICIINNWIKLNGKENVRIQLMKVLPKGYKIFSNKIESFSCEGNLAAVRGTSVTKSLRDEIYVEKYMDE